MRKLGCGDYVREKDGRHIGRVEAVYWPVEVKVRWLGTRWVSNLRYDDLELVKTANGHWLIEPV